MRALTGYYETKPFLITGAKLRLDTMLDRLTLGKNRLDMRNQNRKPFHGEAGLGFERPEFPEEPERCHVTEELRVGSAIVVRALDYHPRS
nr:hypothetical protein [Asaia astilbis]